MTAILVSLLPYVLHLSIPLEEISAYIEACRVSTAALLCVLRDALAPGNPVVIRAQNNHPVIGSLTDRVRRPDAVNNTVGRGVHRDLKLLSCRCKQHPSCSFIPVEPSVQRIAHNIIRKIECTILHNRALIDQMVPQNERCFVLLHLPEVVFIGHLPVGRRIPHNQDTGSKAKKGKEKCGQSLPASPAAPSSVRTAAGRCICLVQPSDLWSLSGCGFFMIRFFHTRLLLIQFRFIHGCYPYG